MMFIGKNWKIESDSLNVILSKRIKRHRKDTGKIYNDWVTMGYFATVKDALHELVNQGIRDTLLIDLKTISAKIDELHTTIQSQRSTAILKGTKGESNDNPRHTLSMVS